MYRLTISLAAALLLAACSDDTPDGGGAVLVEPQSPLIEYVPAETPVYAANAQAMPPAVVDHLWQAVGPTLAQMDRQLAESLDEKHARGDEAEHDGERVIRALAEELRGRLNREGLRSLGLREDGFFAFYTVGLAPVLRLTVDPTAVEQAMARVEARSGVAFARHSLGGVEYLSVSGDAEDPQLLIATHGEQLVVALVPPGETDLAPVLGIDKPSRDISARMLRNAEDLGLVGYGQFEVEVPRLLAAAFAAEGPLAVSMAELDPVCRTEFERLSQVAPRLLGGTTRMSADGVSQRAVLELRPDLASDLMSVTRSMPGLVHSDEGVLHAALAFNLMEVQRFVRERFAAVVADPFECHKLHDLNEQAVEAHRNASQPLPPFVGNILGVRARVESVKAAGPGEMPEVAGMVMLGFDNPQVLLGMAQSFSAEFAALGVRANGEPVPLSGIPQVPAELDDPHLAVLPHGFALSIGAGMDGQLSAFLDGPRPDQPGLLATYSYDPGALMRMQASKLYGEDDPDAQAWRESIERYNAAFDRVSGEIRLTERGIESVQHTRFAR